MNVFTHTIYRLPTDEELKKFDKFPDMTAQEVLNEISYTIVGRGIMSQKNKDLIIESIKRLIELFPDYETYKGSLELAKKLGSRFTKSTNEKLTTEAKEIPSTVYGLVNSFLDSYVDKGVKVPDFLDYLNRIEENFDYILAKIQFKADLINADIQVEDIKEALKDSVRDRIAFLNDITS